MIGVGCGSPRGGGSGGGGTLTIGVYLDAGLTIPYTTGVDLSAQIWIHITTDLDTPTEYRYLIFDDVLDGTRAVNGVATLEWTVRTLNPIIIYAEAVNATAAACALLPFEIDINADADATAFINAHNTASGQTMAAAQQGVIQGLVERLKGFGTTYGSDLWTKLSSSNSEIYPFTPVDDSTVSIPAYALDMVDPSVAAIWNGFIPTDFAVTGVTGGSSKYLAMKRAPSDFGQNDVGCDAFTRSAIGGDQNSMLGATDGNYTNGVFINSGFNAANCTYRTGTVTATGFHSVSRIISTEFKYYKDGITNITHINTSQPPTTKKCYGFGVNSGVLNRPYTGELSMLALRCGLTANEMQDWFESWEYYQSNIITGGRNV